MKYIFNKYKKFSGSDGKKGKESKMINERINFIKTGEISVKGYAGNAIDLIIKKQYYDKSLWKVTAEQFKILSDAETCDWRGEYWGKLMRGACMTYRVTNDKKLYSILTESVKYMLGFQDENGRFSTYSAQNEFCWFDIWCRKYAMLGLISYYGICKNERLKKRVLRAVCRHADYLVKKIGNGRNKIEITETSERFGAMNSCSILGAFIKLYEITDCDKYFGFAKYIVDSGMAKDFDLIKACEDDKLYPYQFKYTKAYEMTSCINGLVEYYKVTGDSKFLRIADEFVDKILTSDYTMIGCSGCTEENFDNSSVRQTIYSDKIMQETCVTVAFMLLCADLLTVTGNAKYAEIIEKSGFNALYGALNTQNQTMKKALAYKLDEKGEVVAAEHEAFVFDSYSPLYLGKRAIAVGGFKVMPGGRGYGCCVSMGGAGTALMGLTAISKTADGFCLNIYNDAKIKSEIGGKKVELDIKASVYGGKGAKIKVKAGSAEFNLRVRIPTYAENFSITVNDEKTEYNTESGYAVLNNVVGGDVVNVKFITPVKAVKLNGKIAFYKGVITLARDERFGEDMRKEINVAVKKDGKVPSAKVVKNDKFDSDLTVKIKTVGGDFITLCDYSSAGKNCDDDNRTVSVWCDLAQK